MYLQVYNVYTVTTYNCNTKIIYNIRANLFKQGTFLCDRSWTCVYLCVCVGVCACTRRCVFLAWWYSHLLKLGSVLISICFKQQAAHMQMPQLCFLFPSLGCPRHVTMAQNQNSKTIKETDCHRTRLMLSRNHHCQLFCKPRGHRHTVYQNTITVNTVASDSWNGITWIYTKHNIQHSLGCSIRKTKMCKTIQ